MKTVIGMAKESGFKASTGKTDKEGVYHPYINALGKDIPVEWLERFAELVRADERGICSDLDFRKEIGLTSDQDYKVSQLILFRGNT